MPYYPGEVIIGPNLIRWINLPAHRRFASVEWARGQIVFGAWRRAGSRNDHFVMVYDVESGKNAKIRFTHYPNGNPDYPFDHVYANHAHLF
jgi:hypothetical protein